MTGVIDETIFQVCQTILSDGQLLFDVAAGKE